MPDDPYEDRLATFGQRLRHARLMADLTQAELTRMVNVSAPTLQRLEWDQGSWETIIARARAIAGVLRCDVDWLIDGTGDVPAHMALDTQSARVRFARIMAGMTSTDLVRKSGVSSVTVHRMQGGPAVRTAFTHYVAVSTALGVNANWLLTGEGPMTGSGAGKASDEQH